MLADQAANVAVNVATPAAAAMDQQTAGLDVGAGNSVVGAVCVGLGDSNGENIVRKRAG